MKKEKQDTAIIRNTLNQSLRSFKVTEDIEITCIRLRQTDSIDLVFRSEKEKERARLHPRWLTSAMPEARMRGEKWYPVKCDGVAKNAVMDLNKDDNKTLRPELLSEFRTQNSTDSIDCTAMKASWLSKSQLKKRVGSLVIWLKHPAAVEYLLQRGTAMFGASGAFCTVFHQANVEDLCYNCNKYGHKQANCNGKTKCGICSNPHNTKNCSQRSSPKCPACGQGGHTVFDKRCKLHPRHNEDNQQQGSVRKQAQGSSSSTGTSSARTAASPVFGPELPPHMQRERRLSAEKSDTEMVDT